MIVYNQGEARNEVILGWQSEHAIRKSVLGKTTLVACLSVQANEFAVTNN